MATPPGAAHEWQERAAAVADPARRSVALPSELMLEIYQHARECYPEEACGLLLGPADREPQRIERCTNVQTRRKLAGESDLDARHGFWIDERELMRAIERAERDAHAVRVIYHSHVDTGAYFSHADLAAALGPDGAPLWPGVAQLVVAVYEEGVRDAAYFVWDAADRRFVGHPVERAD